MTIETVDQFLESVVERRLTLGCDGTGVWLEPTERVTPPVLQAARRHEAALLRRCSADGVPASPDRWSWINEAFRSNGDDRRTV